MDIQDLFSDSVKTLTGGLIGFASALFTDSIRRWLQTPKLELTFDPESTSEYPSVFADGTPNFASDGSRRVTKNAVVRVRNATALRTAKNCRVYLQTIEYKQEVDQSFSLLHDENLPLNWAFADDKPRDIPGQVRHQCDVFYLISGEDKIHHRATAPHFAWDEITQKTGHYRFTILAVADNTRPHKLIFTFHWRGKFADVKTADFALG